MSAAARRPSGLGRTSRVGSIDPTRLVRMDKLSAIGGTVRISSRRFREKVDRLDRVTSMSCSLVPETSCSASYQQCLLLLF
jgi:hypothetical protein